MQSTVKHQLSADEARAQAAELVRKARIKREREEAELARIREREVSTALRVLPQLVELSLLLVCITRQPSTAAGVCLN